MTAYVFTASRLKISLIPKFGIFPRPSNLTEFRIFNREIRIKKLLKNFKSNLNSASNKKTGFSKP